LNTDWGYAVASIDTNVFAGTSTGIYLYGGNGTTWIKRSTGLPSYLGSCILTTQDSLLFVYTGNQTGIFISSNFGQTWKRVDDSTFAQRSVNAMVTSKAYLFAGTGRGAWRTTIANLITSVGDNNNNRLPNSFGLSQNYPNPFNPVTTIMYQVPKRSFVTVRIFSILGTEIAAVVNEQRDAGTYSIQFNASALASGIYFYHLQAGDFNTAKKMILIK